MNQVILGTRGSALALAQARLTADILTRHHPGLRVEQQIFTTRGDLKLDLNLAKGDGGGKGLFTKELEEALLAGSIDVAVHSLKDLPGHNPAGLKLAAVLKREATEDVLITAAEPYTLDTLPQGGSVGTSSIRRARQIQWLRPDLKIEEWRGNVPTRLRKLKERPEISGIVLAAAGLRRLGYTWTDRRLVCDQGEFFAASLGDHLLPAIGQGAIALQNRAEDPRIEALLSVVNHEDTWLCIRAERELQRLLAGDCSIPVGVRCRREGEILRMSAVLFGAEGQPPLRAEASGRVQDPERVAAEVFQGLH